eukprot:1160630-Pelagomonas_calceolata.AAC.3
MHMQRFPKWMWRNTAFAEFVEWLKGFNAARKAEVMGGSIRAAVTGAPPSAAESPASTTTTQRLKGTSIAMDTSPAGPIVGLRPFVAQSLWTRGEHACGWCLVVEAQPPNHTYCRCVGERGVSSIEEDRGPVRHGRILPAHQNERLWKCYHFATFAEAVIKTLSQHNELDAAREVSLRYMCLDRYGADSQAYGMAVGMFNQPSCESAAAAALRKSWDTAEAMRDKDGAEVDEYALAVSPFCVVHEDLQENLRDSHFSDTAKLGAFCLCASPKIQNVELRHPYTDLSLLTCARTKQERKRINYLGSENAPYTNQGKEDTLAQRTVSLSHQRTR